MPSKHDGIKLIMIYSGNISICPVYGHILVDNMTNGFDLYSSSRTAPSRSFVVPTTKIFTKKGVFGEKGHTVITGSDHGKVYVFAVGETESTQRLEHGSESVMVQVVEVSSLFSSKLFAQRCFIFLDNNCCQSSSHLQRIFGYSCQYMHLGETGNIFCYK